LWRSALRLHKCYGKEIIELSKIEVKKEVTIEVKGLASRVPSHEVKQ